MFEIVNGNGGIKIFVGVMQLFEIIGVYCCEDLDCIQRVGCQEIILKVNYICSENVGLFLK